LQWSGWRGHSNKIKKSYKNPGAGASTVWGKQWGEKGAGFIHAVNSGMWQVFVFILLFLFIFLNLLSGNLDSSVNNLKCVNFVFSFWLTFYSYLFILFCSRKESNFRHKMNVLWFSY
jgi:hypothetical protein